MESIVNNLTCLLKNNAFEFGIAGIIFGVSLLSGLVYLFRNRNQVMTIPYGLTLLGMVVLLVLFIFALLLAGIYGATM